MDKFSQLIIEAYRNQNFRFAEDPASIPETEIVAPPALNFAELFTKLQTLDEDKKYAIFTNLSKARDRLLSKYRINSDLPITIKDPTTTPREYVDNSSKYIEENIKKFYYRVMEYLLDNAPAVSSTLATETTTESEESSSAVGTVPSTDSSSGETSATTSSDTSEEPAENISPITIKVSGKEYSPAKYITLDKRINTIGSNSNCTIVLEDESVTEFNCVIQFKDEKWILSKQANSTLAYNGEFVDEFSVLNVGDYFVPGTKGIYILSVEQIGTDNGGLFGSGSGGRGGGFGGRRR